MRNTNNKRGTEELDGQADYRALYEREREKRKNVSALYEREREQRKNVSALYERGREQRNKVSVKRYCDLKDGDIELQLDGGTTFSKVKPEGHEDATCNIKSNMFTKLKASNMISKLGGEEVAIDITSGLFARKNGDGTGTRSGELVFKYANEAMVQNIVHDFLDDAVKTCNRLIKQAAKGTEKLPRLESRSECSMFKERPDHMVVYDIHSHAPLVTIEVKNPLVKRGLHEHPKVCGQGFDYLMATKMSGNVCPMHITTTVDESYVAWLPENDNIVGTFNTNQQTDLGAVLIEIINKVPRLSGGDQFTQSPLKEEKWEGDHSEEKKDETPVTTFIEKEVKREMSSSEIFPSHDLFLMMVNTILCGMYSSSRGNSVCPLDIGVSVYQLALKLSEEKFKWMEIGGITIKGSMKKIPSAPVIYAVGIVGFGATSKAFRVITQDGYEGVLKMYVKKTGEDNKIVLSKKEYQDNALESVKRESTIFNETYPEMPVSKVKLADHYGLLMPFFKPLDHLHLPNESRIIAALKKLKYGQSLHAYYKDEDVRWRHFGKYEGQIVAFDFNDMDKTPLEQKDRKAKISEQCTNLFKRIPAKKSSA